MSFFGEAISYFQRGGFIMWPLLCLSIAAVAIAVERWLFFNKADSGERFKKKFCKLIEQGDWVSAKNFADNVKGEIAKLATIVMERHGNFERLEAFVASRSERALNRFEDYLSYLGVIISLSPVLGLLGTITGMIASFNALNQNNDNPLAVTAGIGEALITTVFGLCISIVAICFHAYFQKRLSRVALDLEEVGNTLLEGVAKNLDGSKRDDMNHV